MGWLPSLRFEIVVTDLNCFKVIPLRTCVNNVLLQFDVGDSTLRVIGVLDVTVIENSKCVRTVSSTVDIAIR